MQFSTSGAQKRSGWSTFERRRDQWKLDQEACTLVCAIVNLDRSLMFLDTPRSDGKTQACPCTHFLRGEEGGLRLGGTGNWKSE